MAFGKPALKPKPASNTYSGNNGALAASRSSSRAFSSRLEAPVDEQRMAYQRSGGSNASSAGGQRTPEGERKFLHSQGSQDQAKSPSFIAATLAASRSVTPNHTGQQLSPAGLRKASSFTRGGSPSVRSVSSKGSLDQPLDTSSIPPTNSLIGMFEQNNAKGQAVKKKRPVVKSPVATVTQVGSPEAQHDPTPVRARRPSPLADKVQKQKQKPEIKSPKPTLPATFTNKPIEAPKPKPIPAPRDAPVTTAKPSPPARKSYEEVEEDDSSSNDSFVTVSDYTPSFRAVLNQQRRNPSSTNTKDPINNAAAIDAMANAIVASSLASSRAASPSHFAPPAPPPRKHRFHNSKHETPSSSSPAKPTGLRTTMRVERKDDEVDEAAVKRGRKKMVRKHPNKHHEGDRKRWRDEVTERERKRYEAVWASNKGLYCEGIAGGEMGVCSLVVRDVWSRSRLNGDVLEEVYALVDRAGRGFLEKEEFVVGLWLVDQRLKGRKLPPRVTESVWGSAGVLGVKLRRAGK